MTPTEQEDTVTEALAAALEVIVTDSDGDQWRLVPMTLDGGLSPTTPASRFVDPVSAALTASGWSIVRSEEMVGRTAASMHMEGEVDDCDGSESLWCQPCWDEAVAWLAPDADYAMAREVRAALEKGPRS